MSIKVFMPCYDEEEGTVECFEKEEVNTYYNIAQNFRQVYGDTYQLIESKVPAYSYDDWCGKGEQHSQEIVGEAIIYRRVVRVPGKLFEFDTIEQYSAFLAEQSPVEIEVGRYTLLDGTPVIGATHYEEW